MSEGVKERLARLRERAAQSRAREEPGGADDGGEKPTTAAERLAALRARKQSLMSTPKAEEGARKREVKAGKHKPEEEGDESDDEGVTTDESDLDENGTPMLTEEGKVKPLEGEGDPRGLAFRRAVPLRPDIGVTPTATTVVSHVEKFLAYPTGRVSQREAAGRRQSAARNMLALAGASIEVLGEPLTAGSEEDREDAEDKGGAAVVAIDELDREDDMSGDLESMQLLEEGFFVPKVPRGVSRTNVARIEDRLLREMTLDVVAEHGARRRGSFGGGGQRPEESSKGEEEEAAGAECPARASHWFTRGGAMNVLEDPRKAIMTQPIDADSILANEDALERCSTYLVPASSLASGVANPHGVECASLDVTINTVAFDDHPLYIQEDVAACKLRSLFRKYQSRAKERLVEHLTAHIQGLIVYERTLANGDASREALMLVRRQLIDMFSRRLAEELQVRELARETYDQWIELKRVRAEQGFVSTSLKLAVMQVETPYTDSELAEQFAFVKRLVQEMSEVNEEDEIITGKHEAPLAGNALLRAKDMLKRYGMTRPSQLGSKRRSSRKGGRRGSRDASSENEFIAEEFALRLTEDGAYSKDDEVDAREQKRRRSARQERVHVKLFVNGRYVARTKDASLAFPSFTASWRRVFRLKLMQRPSTIRLDLCAGRAGLSMLGKIASVHVPVPASALGATVLSYSVSPEDHWHQFSSLKAIRSWAWDQPRAKASTLREMYAGHLKSEQVQTTPIPEERHTSGLIRACVAWSCDLDKEDADPNVAIGDAQQGGVANVGLPATANSRVDSNKRFLGGPANDLAGGSKSGGGSGVSADAVEFDDDVPDFANEVDFQQLIKQMEGLDPNDPRNSSVMRLFDIMKWASKRGVLFRSEALMREALFPTANTQKFIESRRTALLKIRKEKPYLIHQPIPQSEDEIKDDESFQTLLLPVEARLELEQEGSGRGHGHTGVGRIQRMQRARVNDFMQRVRELQAERSRSTRKRDIPLSSIIKEGPLPEFNVSMDLFQTLFEPRRKLRPAPKARKPASLSVEKASIFVQVVRATNVPVRRHVTNGKYPSSPGRSPLAGGSPIRQRELAGTEASTLARSGDNGRGRDDDGDDDDDADQVNAGPERVTSFLQVRFQGSSRRSSAQEGPTPTWNESVFLPFIPPRKDFSPSNLQSISEHVWFNLFDEVIVEAEGNDYRNEDQTFQRRERRFLGSFSIPFSTIYMNGKIEGMFRVQTPEVNLGYVTRSRGNTSRPAFSSAETSVAGIANELQDEAANATYVYLMATLDPVLATANEDNTAGLGAGENPKIVRYAKQWLKTAKGKLRRKSNAEMQIFGTSISGDAIFAPRFLAPQVPPVGRDGTELSSIHSLVRFVSLVPFLEDWQAFVEGGNDVWSTSQEFLDISAGDWEEHAILLCNYFTWLFRDRPAVESYIVLGRGIPEGDTVYVLLADTTEQIRILFNASDGRGYITTDKHCPLRDVCLVMNDRNIYANTQETGDPALMRWNLGNAKDWLPFWTDRVTRIDLPSVQTELLSYERLDRKFVSYLEGEISDSVQKSMRRWRAKIGTTRFNKIVGRKLRGLLELHEERRLGLRDSEATLEDEHFKALKEALASNHIVGFPLNMTFTEIDAILKAVRNTDIHNTAVENTTFALGVLVVPYTNKVLSVWVYIAALTSSR